MGKWWSLLFAVVLFLCGLLFVVAPMVGWWLPEAVSTHAWDVDKLFYIILAVTGFFYVLTEALLCIFMYKYCACTKALAPAASEPGFVAKLCAPAMKYLNDPHKVEMAWTIVPAIILLYIAFAQVSAWANIKYQSRMPHFAQKDKDFTPLQVDVTARQWEWRIRYPSSERFRDWMKNKGSVATQKDFQSFAKFEQKDDIKVVNELHVWKDHPVVVHLSTRDVLHSFNIPSLRVKQDSLPGRTIPVWFTPTKHNTIKQKNERGQEVWLDGHHPVTKEPDTQHVWDIACAELCGWGHYRMIGRLYVHESQTDFLDWLESVERQNQPPRKQ